MHPIVRTAISVGTAVAAASVMSTVTAHAYDRIDTLQPIPAGHSYVYYVKELDPARLPLGGRPVTMKLAQGAGSDATVAPSDSAGHPTGPAGKTATENSGADGLAFFILKTSTTPGENVWTWQDPTYTGEVVVYGSQAGAASGAGAGSGGRRHARPLPPASTRLPQGAIPPLGAALIAGGLVWLLAPPLLRRQLGDLELPATLGASPAAQTVRP